MLYIGCKEGGNFRKIVTIIWDSFSGKKSVELHVQRRELRQLERSDRKTVLAADWTNPVLHKS